jgi:HPt (histidine-containing phosphotransfer) domain-containing protein
VFDPGLLAVVQNLIPPERLHVYLRDLDQQLRVVAGCAAGDAGLEAQAHQIVSQAGMLGLTRVARCAGSLEDACRSGYRERALLQLRVATEDVRLYAMPAAGVAVG